MRASPGESKQSRAQLAEKRGLDISLPDITGLELMIEYLVEAGEARRGMAGLDPLTPADIKGWMDLIGIDIGPVKAMMLVRLSRAYAHQANISADEKCVSPCSLDDLDMSEVRERADKKIRSLF